MINICSPYPVARESEFTELFHLDLPAQNCLHCDLNAGCQSKPRIDWQDFSLRSLVESYMLRKDGNGWIIENKNAVNLLCRMSRITNVVVLGQELEALVFYRPVATTEDNGKFWIRTDMRDSEFLKYVEDHADRYHKEKKIARLDKESLEELRVLVRKKGISTSIQ